MKLPSVFANKDINVKDNNKKSCVTCNGLDRDKLRSYFDNDGYVNKLDVRIITKDGIRDDRLILYKDQYVVNINNERIYLEDIIDFTIKK